MIAEVFLSQNETPCSHWERSVGLGKKDDVTSVYFRDDERYADLINVHIFSGLPVVTPEQVREKDTRVQGVIRKIKERFQTDLREVFGFIQRSGDREKLRRYVEERKEQFEHLEEDAYDLMIQMTGSGELISLQDEWRDEGGKIDMCKALRDWAEEERKEGRKEGHQDIARNMYRRHTPLEEIAEICEVSVEQVKIWAERWENR